MSALDVLTAAPGTIFRGKPKTLSLARSLAFSGGAFDTPGWPERNLHTDLAVANETGLAKVVASGTQFEGYLASHLLRVFGHDWYSHGAWDVKIVRSVKVDDVVTPIVKLTARTDESGAIRIQAEVWCENQDAEKVLTGTASCLLRSRSEALTR
ncbi:MAG: MaoC family dehydratase [Burkholderiales bacterium]|nr:MaoC family dehydratase [Burkholderiales bacterium]